MRGKISKFSALIMFAAVLVGVYSRLGAQTPTRPRVVSRAGGATGHRPASAGSTFEPPEIKAELVAYPDAKVAFICGPQLKVNSPLNLSPWFDSTQVRSGHIHGKETPAIAPRTLTGSVSATPNARVVTGIGTRFLSEIDPGGPAPFYNGWLRILDGTTYREVRAASVQSDTQLT